VQSCSPTGGGATAAGPAAELLAEVRRWLAEERITQTIVWIGEQPFAVSG
jgi:hypothetical protein